jgi:hypothetical protein
MRILKILGYAQNDNEKQLDTNKTTGIRPIKSFKIEYDKEGGEK